MSQQTASQRALEDLIIECKDFIALKNKNRYSGGTQPNVATYLINKHWWRNYKKYIHYKDVKMHRKPYESQTDLHPGSIDNEERLCITGEEADQ